jgi:hypothetical protein
VSNLIDKLSEYLARRKGLLPLVGILLIAVNFVLQFAAPHSWITTSNMGLHIGLVLAIFGLMLAWAL